jgi:hypothetical protein
MTDSKPTRQYTLALLLGASSFDYAPSLAQGRRFYNSAYDFREYLLAAEGLNLHYNNVLSLFDDSQAPSDQLKRARDFLEKKTAALRHEGTPPQNLIVYYIGHGLFSGPEQTYCIAIRATDEVSEGVTSIRVSDLASIIKEHARFVRKFIILDCCFSSAAYKAFQGAPLRAGRVKLLGEFPERGTTLLCSASAYDASLAPEELSHTMFSGGLLRALREGHPSLGPQLSMSELGDLVKVKLKEAYPENWVRPEVHSPDQREGDIASEGLFPNAAFMAEAQREQSEIRVQKGAEQAGLSAEARRTLTEGQARNGAKEAEADQRTQEARHEAEVRPLALDVGALQQEAAAKLRADEAARQASTRPEGEPAIEYGSKRILVRGLRNWRPSKLSDSQRGLLFAFSVIVPITIILGLNWLYWTKGVGRLTYDPDWGHISRVTFGLAFVLTVAAVVFKRPRIFLDQATSPQYLTSRIYYISGLLVFELIIAALFIIISYISRVVMMSYPSFGDSMNAYAVESIIALLFVALLNREEVQMLREAIDKLVGIPHHRLRAVVAQIMYAVSVPKEFAWQVAREHNEVDEFDFLKDPSTFDRQWAELSYIRRWLIRQSEIELPEFFTHREFEIQNLLNDYREVSSIVATRSTTLATQFQFDKIAAMLTGLRKKFARVVGCYLVYRYGVNNSLGQAVAAFGVTVAFTPLAD